MQWTYRVLRRIENGEENFYIVEVFYDSDDDGITGIIGWSEKEILWGEGADGLDGLRQSLLWMLAATDQPILDEAELLQRAEEIEALGADLDEVGIEALGATQERSEER